MRQGLEEGSLTPKECKVSLQTTLTRELKAKHWVASLECLAAMHDLALVPSAPSLAAFVQVRLVEEVRREMCARVWSHSAGLGARMCMCVCVHSVECCP
jgi:hypothetical protein